MDPRIILYEGPSETPNILEEVSIVLKLPLLKDMQLLEFFVETGPEGDAREEKPDVQVDLRESIKKYEEEGGMDQYAECQEPVYKPNALEK